MAANPKVILDTSPSANNFFEDLNNNNAYSPIPFKESSPPPAPNETADSFDSGSIRTFVFSEKSLPSSSAGGASPVKGGSLEKETISFAQKQPHDKHKNSHESNQIVPEPSASLSHLSANNGKINRKRSNSKSRRSILPPQMTPANEPEIPKTSAASSLQSQKNQQHPTIDVAPLNNTTNANNSNTNNSTGTFLSKIDRYQVQYVLILTSLNNTFETKTLLIPYYPNALKLGRPAGVKIQPTPTNGYFDSRVLSRTHAQLSIDMATGKLFLKDLGSSNGTFVNDKKISSDKDSEPTEIKKGDIINFGFDIDTHQNHRKICAKVENILIRPVSGKSKNNYAKIINGTSDSNSPGSQLKNKENINTSGTQNYVDDLDKIKAITLENELKNSISSNSFDSILFGDILPNFEDNVLNIKSDSMTGLSINSNLTTASSLDFQIKTLINEIYMAKNTVLKNKAIEVFLKKYIKNLKKIENEKSESNKLKLKELEQNLMKNYEKNYRDKHAEIENKLKKLNLTNSNLNVENDQLKSINKQNQDSLQSLHSENEKINEEFKKFTTKSDADLLNLKEKNKTLEESLKSKDDEFQSRLTSAILEEKELLVNQLRKKLCEKSVQTENIGKKKQKLDIIQDNDSDSSTLNDDDIRNKLKSLQQAKPISEHSSSTNDKDNNNDFEDEINMQLPNEKVITDTKQISDTSYSSESKNIHELQTSNELHNPAEYDSLLKRFNELQLLHNNLTEQLENKSKELSVLNKCFIDQKSQIENSVNSHESNDISIPLASLSKNDTSRSSSISSVGASLVTGINFARSDINTSPSSIVTSFSTNNYNNIANCNKNIDSMMKKRSVKLLNIEAEILSNNDDYTLGDLNDTPNKNNRQSAKFNTLAVMAISMAFGACIFSQFSK